MMFKFFMILIFFVLPYKKIFSQDWVIYLKPGAAMGIAALGSSSTGYIHKKVPRKIPFPSLGFEVSRGFPGKGTKFFGGIKIFPVAIGYIFNERNVDVSRSYGGGLSGLDFGLQVYGCVNKSFRKEKWPEYKNYFSFFGGLGFGFFPKGNTDFDIRVNEFGITKNGEQFSGTDFNWVNNIPGAPIIIAGVRYHITNSKGKDVAVVELATGINLIKYFDHRVTYQLNGQNRIDYLAEKSIDVQLNVLIPIKTVYKKSMK
jgi:hypothetical protein